MNHRAPAATGNSPGAHHRCELRILENPSLPECAPTIARALMDAAPSILAEAKSTGLKIALGSHAVISPHGQNAREIALRVEAELSAIQAIIDGSHDGTQPHWVCQGSGHYLVQGLGQQRAAKGLLHHVWSQFQCTVIVSRRHNANGRFHLRAGELLLHYSALESC